MVSGRSFMSPQNSAVTFPSADASLKDFRQRLSLDHRKAEPEVLLPLIARAWLSIPERERVVQQALGLDRKSVVSGKSVSVRVDLGGGRIIKKNNYNIECYQ